MRKFLTVMMLTFFCVSLDMHDACAVILSGQPPRFTGDAAGDPLVDGTLNNELADAFYTVLDMANQELAQYDNQEKLATAFSDANSYASHAVEFWGYEGYDKIAFLGGLALALEMPSLDSDALSNALDDIEETGDAQIGASLGGGLNLGIHLGWLNTRARDWYVNVKFFMYNLSIPYNGYTFNYDNLTLGFGFNYQVVRQKKFGNNLFLWRGISVSSHFLFQRSTMDYGINIEEQVASLEGDFADDDLDLILYSKVKLKLVMDTYTLPIDIVTSLRMLYFLNISLGVGIDFVFGNSEVTAEGTAYAHLDGNPGIEYGFFVPGYVNGEVSTAGAPFALRGRFMLGMGINIGPAVLCDFNLTYYLTTGIAMNISAGFAW